MTNIYIEGNYDERNDRVIGIASIELHDGKTCILRGRQCMSNLYVKSRSVGAKIIAVHEAYDMIFKHLINEQGPISFIFNDEVFPGILNERYLPRTEILIRMLKTSRTLSDCASKIQYRKYETKAEALKLKQLKTIVTWVSNFSFDTEVFEHIIK